MSSEFKTLSLHTLDYPFETLVNRINEGKLKLDPEFQRKYKWDKPHTNNKSNWERASKFIESCLMRIPLPSCYFAEDDGYHIVIDGVQRLTTIQRFVNDEFALENLTHFTELNGKKFSELGDLKDDFLSTTIRCILLRKENDKSLIREIFARLNQGAVELSHQEIRHAIYPSKFNDLLSELAKNPIIQNFKRKSVTSSSLEKDNLESEEQVLRFFALSDNPDLKNFSTFKEFLDEYMEKQSKIDDDNIIQEYRNKFYYALNNCITVFGEEKVFTNPTNNARNTQSLVHYDLLMHSLSSIDNSIIQTKKEQIKLAYIDLCNDSRFKKRLNNGIQKKSNIIKRQEDWNKALLGALNG